MTIDRRGTRRPAGGGSPALIRAKQPSNHDHRPPPPSRGVQHPPNRALLREGGGVQLARARYSPRLYLPIQFVAETVPRNDSSSELGSPSDQLYRNAVMALMHVPLTFQETRGRCLRRLRRLRLACGVSPPPVPPSAALDGTVTGNSCVSVGLNAAVPPPKAVISHAISGATKTNDGARTSCSLAQTRRGARHCPVKPLAVFSSASAYRLMFSSI